MNNRNRNNSNINTNNSNNNYRKTYANSNDKRFNNWRDQRDHRPERNDRNQTNGRFGPDLRPKQDTNRANNGQRGPNREELNGSAHLPGIAVQRNQSSPPFVDTTTGGSGDHNEVKPKDAQELDQMSKQLAEMEVKDSKSENKETESAKSDASVEPGVKSATIYNKDRRPHYPNGSTNGFNSMVRRNTIGSEFRPQRRFNRNEMNGNFGFNNSHKFYRQNDRFFGFNSNNRYEANDKKGFKANPSKPFPQSAQTSSGCDFNANGSQVQPYSGEVPNAYFNCLVPNYYTQSFNYPTLAPPLSSNTSDKSGQLAINGSQSQDKNGKKGEQNNSSNDTVPFVTQFIPYEPSALYPVPPNYFGYVAGYNTENGFFYYFISVCPPNILPLQLEVNHSGIPVLPSNCVINYFN